MRSASSGAGGEERSELLHSELASGRPVDNKKLTVKNRVIGAIFNCDNFRLQRHSLMKMRVTAT